MTPKKVAMVDQLNFPLKSFHFFRVGFITPEYIHVECNFQKIFIITDINFKGHFSKVEFNIQVYILI